MIRRTVTTQVRSLGEDEVEVICSTDRVVEQDGLLLLPSGADLETYRTNPIVLFGHNPEEPIARTVEIGAKAGALPARIRFAPPGISALADKIRGLVKNLIISAVSIGFDFDPADAEWIDPKNPRAGRRVTRWRLYEISFVAVGADPGALVTARALRSGAASDAVRRWAAGVAPVPASFSNPYIYDPNCPLPMVERVARWNMAHVRAVTRAGLPDADFEERQQALRRRRAQSVDAERR